MSEKWTLKKILGLLLGIASLACLIVSMFIEGNNIFLIIWSLGVYINSILFISIKRCEK